MSSENITTTFLSPLVIHAVDGPLTVSQRDHPVGGKRYAMNGPEGTPCIAAGNSWAESEIKEEAHNDWI